MFVFIDKWRKKTRFLTCCMTIALPVTLATAQRACEKRVSLFECLPYVRPEPVLVKR
jgi:hypothetical protein